MWIFIPLLDCVSKCLNLSRQILTVSLYLYRYLHSKSKLWTISHLWPMEKAKFSTSQGDEGIIFTQTCGSIRNKHSWNRWWQSTSSFNKLLCCFSNGSLLFFFVGDSNSTLGCRYLETVFLLDRLMVQGSFRHSTKDVVFLSNLGNHKTTRQNNRGGGTSHNCNPTTTRLHT